MSEALTISVSDQEPTRRSREDRERDRPADTGPVIEDGSPDFNDPIKMLADSQKAIEEKDRQVAEAQRQAREAQTQAARARDEAARANMARAGDRAAAVASAVETAKADQATAKAAKRAARDAGDIDAEMQADELFASASYRLNQATGELAWLEQQGKQARPQGQPQPQQPAMSDEARAWIEAHPQFHTDDDYKAVAEGAHNAAVRAGHPDGSPGYIPYINKVMERFYGPDHGQGGAPLQRGNPDMNTRRSDSTSSAGPSNRGGGGGGARGGTVNTPLGPLHVTEAADGKVRIQIPQADRADWDEAASVNQMSVAEYAYEQVKIARELAAGGDAGWVRGDGQIGR